MNTKSKQKMSKNLMQVIGYCPNPADMGLKAEALQGCIGFSSPRKECRGPQEGSKSSHVMKLLQNEPLSQKVPDKLAVK